MPAKYSLVPRKNPAKKNDPAKYYAQVQTSNVQDFKTLTRAVSDSCTVTSSDSKAVLDAFMNQMLRALASGEIVRLNDLGSFRLSVSSKGTESEKEFKAHMITKARIIFTPCKELKEMLKTLSFEKSGLITAPREAGEEEGEPEDPIV